MNKPISSLFVFSVVYCVVFRQKLKILGENRKQQKETETETEQLEEKHKQTEIQDIQPSTRPRINISQVPAGRFMFLCVFVFL